jgi:hypothetical protein
MLLRALRRHQLPATFDFVVDLAYLALGQRMPDRIGGKRVDGGQKAMPEVAMLWHIASFFGLHRRDGTHLARPVLISVSGNLPLIAYEIEMEGIPLS